MCKICHYQQNVPQHYYLLDTLVTRRISISHLEGLAVATLVLKRDFQRFWGEEIDQLGLKLKKEWKQKIHIRKTNHQKIEDPTSPSPFPQNNYPKIFHYRKP